MKRFSRRTLLATIALVVGVAGPLGFGWWTGRAAALAEAEALRQAPRAAAREAGERVALKVLDRLDAMVAKEAERPYFHYQNFFVDPGGAYAGTAVVPSPLATGNGTNDPLVLAYFQIDQAGTVTMPSVPEGVEDAAAPNPLDVALLGELRRADIPRPTASIAIALASEPIPVPLTDKPVEVVAVNEDVQQQANSWDANTQLAEAELSNKGNFTKSQVQQKVQEVVLDPEQYKQNVDANRLYNELNAANPKGKLPRKNPKNVGKPGPANTPASNALEVEQAPSEQAPIQQEVQQEVQQPMQNQQRRPKATLDTNIEQTQQQAEVPEPDAEDGVVVRMGPFEWETLRIGNRPSLAALRHIVTPEGVRSQGFVVSHEALEELARDGETQALLLPPDSTNGRPGVEVAMPGTGWRVLVPSAQAEAAAERAADELVTDFQMRFAGMGLLALLALTAVIIALVQADRHLERRQRFAAAAAHELRTPLAGLRMYAEMIALGLGKPDKQKVYAERLATEAGRLGRVVANVLDFTRLERGNLSVKPERRDLVAAVDEQVTRLEPSVRAAGATLVCERPDAAIEGSFDNDALAQIIANLVDNAEKYGRESPDRTIVVSVERGARGPEVHVKDRGPGLRQGFESRLFRPFARGDERDGPAGLGLGLALTRALARAQQGDIRFTRRVGGGAEFIVDIAA